MKILIVTAITVELNAVKIHFTGLVKKRSPQGMVFLQTKLAGEGNEIYITQVGYGIAQAATETTRAIEFVKPEYVFFVGIAGALKESLRIGDVIVADKVYDYATGRADETVGNRPELFRASPAILHECRHIISDEAWLKNIKHRGDTANGLKHAAQIKPIASGGYLVVSRKSDIYKDIISKCQDAVAVEMEGYGFLNSIDSLKNVEGIVIRGISDLVDEKHISDAQGGQELASAAAAAFMYTLIDEIVSFSSHVDISQSDRYVALIEEKILGRFRQQRSQVNHVVDERWIRNELISSINPKEAQYVDKTVELLKERGIISVEKRTGMVCLVLTAHGFNELYK